MWEQLFAIFLERFVRRGRLVVTLPSGRVVEAGRGSPSVSVAVTDPALVRRLCLNPELALGEGYMDGSLTVAGDDLTALFEVLFSNFSSGDALPLWQRPLQWLRRQTRLAGQRNIAARARRNVAHHYDLSGALYDLFLDADRQYSCAYFAEPGLTLEQAQAAKKHHIARKLLLRPGMRVLDIGCGWGGMALTLAQDYGAEVLGVTLSEEQLRIARERAQAAGLADRVRFELKDYRKVDGTFDRIVSVGMFEHVGVPHYREYFGKVRDLLTPDGVALIHTIGRMAPPDYAPPWIVKYIFPGGYTPSLSEVVAAVEETGLVEADIEVWRLHYARTLRHWHDRFAARADEARAIYDDRFVRMWRFYLLSCEASFRVGRQVVFQLQLARAHGAVPVTRDYLYPAAADRPRLTHAAE